MILFHDNQLACRSWLHLACRYDYIWQSCFVLPIFLVDLCPRIGGKIGWQFLDMLVDLDEDYINLIENRDHWLLIRCLLHGMLPDVEWKCLFGKYLCVDCL